MFKNTNSLMLALIFISSLYANDITESQKFIGVEIGISEVQGDSLNRTTKERSDGSSFGLRLGAQNEQWRTTVGLHFFDAEGRNVEKLYGSIDYFLFVNDDYESLLLRPFIGINLGYANYESYEVDADGFTYGGQGGILINLSDNISVDMSYRYTLSSAIAFDHSEDIVFGLNYQY